MAVRDVPYPPLKSQTRLDRNPKLNVRSNIEPPSMDICVIMRWHRKILISPLHQIPWWMGRYLVFRLSPFARVMSWKPLEPDSPPGTFQVQGVIVDAVNHSMGTWESSESWSSPNPSMSWTVAAAHWEQVCHHKNRVKWPHQLYTSDDSGALPRPSHLDDRWLHAQEPNALGSMGQIKVAGGDDYVITNQPHMSRSPTNLSLTCASPSVYTSPGVG